MRRDWRQRGPRRIFRGAELSRLMTGVLMLFVLYMMITRARDTESWRWLVKSDADAAKPVAEKPVAEKLTKDGGETKPKPPVIEEPTGPTDEDPDEAAEAKEEFQAVTDGTCRVQREEMEPYDRLVAWVKNQSFARLESRAKKGLRYTNFYDDIERHRGELVELNVEVRMSSDAGKNRFGVPLHEAWAVTEESRGRLYSLIVVDYPKAMPVGFNICAKAKFVGYLLKLQGYEPASAKPGQRPEKAPLLIGRFEWIPPVVAESPIDATQEWIWGGIALAVIGAVLLVRAIYLRWFRPKSPELRRVFAEPGSDEVVPIETWLEHGGFDPNDDGEATSSDESHEGTVRKSLLPPGEGQAEG